MLRAAFCAREEDRAPWVPKRGRGSALEHAPSYQSLAACDTQVHSLLAPTTAPAFPSFLWHFDNARSFDARLMTRVPLLVPLNVHVMEWHMQACVCTRAPLHAPLHAPLQALSGGDMHTCARIHAHAHTDVCDASVPAPPGDRRTG